MRNDKCAYWTGRLTCGVLGDRSSLWHNSEQRKNWKIAFAMTAGLRVIYSAFAAVAAVFVHPSASLIQSNVLAENLPAPGGWHYALFGIWERFDTLWYLRIAKRGLGGLVGPIAAALLISTVAAFFYLWGLLRLIHSEFPDMQPLRTLTLA